MTRPWTQPVDTCVRCSGVHGGQHTLPCGTSVFQSHLADAHGHLLCSTGRPPRRLGILLALVVTRSAASAALPHVAPTGNGVSVPSRLPSALGPRGLRLGGGCRAVKTHGGRGASPLAHSGGSTRRAALVALQTDGGLGRCPRLWAPKVFLSKRCCRASWSSPR